MSDCQGLADASTEAAATVLGDDGLPAETSLMESVAVTTEPGGEGEAPGGDDPWGFGYAQDSLTSNGEEQTTESEGRASAQALAAARAHLAAVAEELAMIQSQFGESAPGDVEGSGSPSSQGKGVIPIQSKQEMERSMRHLEVDLECANARADRLAHENEELLASQARMEAELRTARKGLEETRLRLQHREMDLRKASGAGPDALQGGELSPKQSTSFDAEKGSEKTVSLREADAIAPRPIATMTKQQAVAALRAAQSGHRDERKRRERLERRVQKDQERLERLVAVAEAQQAEIRSLQLRCWQSEASAQECMARLHETAAHSSALQMALQGARPDSRGSNQASASEAGARRLATPPFGGRAGNSGALTPTSLTRQQSAPTRLPSVTPAPKRG